MKLYDGIADVVRKVLIGRGIEPSVLADELGMNMGQFRRYLDGAAQDLDLDRLAASTGLSEAGLKALVSDRPFPSLPDFVERLELPFEDETVNAWWIEHRGLKILVDAGWRAADLEFALEGRKPDLVLITHAHRDHTGGLTFLRGYCRCFGPVESCEPICEGPWEIHGLTIVTHPLPGHLPTAIGYELRLVDAGEPRLFFPGDACFASSMGGCPHPQAFQSGCMSLGAALDVLPSTTLLLPGHGAATTVALERELNPFAPFWGISPTP